MPSSTAQRYLENSSSPGRTPMTRRRLAVPSRISRSSDAAIAPTAKSMNITAGPATLCAMPGLTMFCPTTATRSTLNICAHRLVEAEAA